MSSLIVVDRIDFVFSSMLEKSEETLKNRAILRKFNKIDRITHVEVLQ